MVIDMKKDKLVIMDWGGVVESHSEESYLAHNVVKHVLEQFTTEPLPLNFKEVFEQSLMVDGVPINEIAGTKKLQPYLDKLFAACHIEVHPELYIDFMDIYTQIHQILLMTGSLPDIWQVYRRDAIQEYCPILPYWMDHARTDSLAGSITITDGCLMRSVV